MRRPDEKWVYGAVRGLCSRLPDRSINLKALAWALIAPGPLIFRYRGRLDSMPDSDPPRRRGTSMLEGRRSRCQSLDRIPSPLKKIALFGMSVGHVSRRNAIITATLSAARA
jgi:hypothetical protein